MSEHFMIRNNHFLKWNVGFYDLNGSWITESVWNNPIGANHRAEELNDRCGDSLHMSVKTIRCSVTGCYCDIIFLIN